jgi:hypothetical protein
MHKKKAKKVRVRDLKPRKNPKGGAPSDIPVTKAVDKSTPFLHP